MNALSRQRQARLLDRYVALLRRAGRGDRAAGPPPGLDPELAELAVLLEHDLEWRDPSAAYASQVWNRLDQPASTPAATGAWSEPALDRRKPAPVVVPPGDVEEEDRPVPLPTRNWAREAAKLAAAALVFGLVGAILALTLRGAGNDPDVAQPPSGGVGALIPAGSYPIAPVFGAGSLWVPDQLDGTLTRIDPATNQVVATIQIVPPYDGPDIPRGSNMTVAVVGDTVWVARWDASLTSDPIQALVKIDAATNEIVATVALDVRPNGIAADDGGIWIAAAYDHVVVRVDPATLDVAATVPVRDAYVIALGEGAVWVTSESARSVTRIDPATNQVVAAIQTGAATAGVATGAGAVWATSYDDGTLLRINPATNAIVSVVPIAEPGAVAYGDGSVWVMTGSGTLQRVDPGDNAVVASYHTGRVSGPGCAQCGTAAPQYTLALGDGSAWVTDERARVVIRVNP